MALENKIVIVWTREDFERVLETTLTDKEWELLASEVQGDIEEIYVPEVLFSKFDNLEHLMEQDK